MSQSRPPKTPVAIVDDDVPFVRSVQGALEHFGRHQVVATAHSAEAALRWPATIQPRVLLLDIGLPGLPGSKAVEQFLRTRPDLLIVMLTARTEADVLLEAMSAGAAGYLMKGAPLEQIVAAVDDALAGGAPMSPGIARRVLTLMRQPARATPPSPELAELTARESEILQLVADGLADKEIADRLQIAQSTVKNHLANVYDKWCVRSRTEAAVRFVRAVK